jgi:hypothetical protein
MIAPIFELHAERAALGAMLSNTAAAERGVALLRRDDFYCDRERRVFDAMVGTLRDGGFPDVVTVAAALGADSEMRAYVTTLPDACPGAANIGRYIAIVQQSSWRRRLMGALNQMKETADANGMAADELHRRCLELLTGAAPAATATGGSRPRSYTGPEIALMVAERSDPVLLYADPGCLFDLVAPSKEGKTTLVALACRAALRGGEPFLDLPTKRVPILYLTEQTRVSFKAKLETVGFLSSCEDFHVLFIADFVGSSWEEICAVIREEVRRWSIGLIAIDTLTDWAHMENENDAAEALSVTRPLRAIAEETGAAVLTIRHTGKGQRNDGKVVDSGRGSSAFAGVADTLCVLGGVPGQGHPNRRQLRFVSRKENVPASMIIELKAGQYVALGDAPNVEYRLARDFVVEHLPNCEDAAITEKEILAACNGLFSRRTLQRVLNGEHGVGGLLRDGIVTGKLGAGSAGTKAFGYWLLHDDNNEQLGLPDEY